MPVCGVRAAADLHDAEVVDAARRRGRPAGLRPRVVASALNTSNASSYRFSSSSDTPARKRARRASGEAAGTARAAASAAA